MNSEEPTHKLIGSIAAIILAYGGMLLLWAGASCLQGNTEGMLTGLVLGIFFSAVTVVLVRLLAHRHEEDGDA